jgi:hypothetical protein
MLVELVKVAVAKSGTVSGIAFEVLSLLHPNKIAENVII